LRVLCLLSGLQTGQKPQNVQFVWQPFKENQMNFEKIMDYVTAVSIGVGMAVLLVAWWST
jgi:hypothetical protein